MFRDFGIAAPKPVYSAKGTTGESVIDVPFGGGCACGAIRYECKGPPRDMGNCHCTACRQATGSAYFAAVMVKESEFSLLRGKPSWFERASDKGHPMQRGFCPACGSPLFLLNGANMAVRVLFAGSLDDPSEYKPGREIYVASAQPWDLLHPDIPHDEGLPGR